MNSEEPGIAKDNTCEVGWLKQRGDKNTGITTKWGTRLNTSEAKSLNDDKSHNLFKVRRGICLMTGHMYEFC